MYRFILKTVNGILHEQSSRRSRARLRTPQKPVLFIVGAPRTGSTILYQVLTAALEVAYLNNLAQYLHGNLPLAMKLSRVFLGAGTHQSFTSRYGATRQAGLNAPSECGAFWYRWFDIHNHYVAELPETSDAVIGVRDELAGVIEESGKPLVVKNLNMGQRLQFLSSAIPDARILWCRRDPRFTVQSILAARKAMGWPEDELWSVKPREWRDLAGKPLVEQVCRQVLRLEAQIEDDLSLFRQVNISVVDYEEWPYRRDELISEVARNIDASLRREARLPEIRCKNEISDYQQFEEIEKTLNMISSEQKSVSEREA